VATYLDTEPFLDEDTIRKCWSPVQGSLELV
jgi:hypothetical protein